MHLKIKMNENYIYTKDYIIIQHENSSFKHLFVLKAAPTKAQIAEIQRQILLRSPTLPYLQLLNTKVNIAAKGAKIQNKIICNLFDPPHQYTILIPILMKVAAITHPK